MTAIVAGMAIVVAAVTGFLVTPWVTAGASLVGDYLARDR